MHCIAQYGSAPADCQYHRVLESKLMKKDSQFTFRIPSDLKARLEEIALTEGRSVAQICVVLLQDGTETYKKRGAEFFAAVTFRRKREICELATCTRSKKSPERRGRNEVGAEVLLAIGDVLANEER